MQNIGGELYHIALVPEADKGIITKLTEAVEELTRNNASLMTQLSDVTKINIKMNKKLNIKATQNPEDKRLADKAKRKSAFEKNLNSDSYFWTHGFRFTKRHSSQTYSAPAVGNQTQASRKISWEIVRLKNDTGVCEWKIVN